MAYSPGILSQMLQHDSSVESSVKPTKLQALFSKSTEQHLASRKNLHVAPLAPLVSPTTAKVRELKPSVQSKVGKTQAKETITSSSDLMFRREEGLRNAEEGKLDHKQKKAKHVQNTQSHGFSEGEMLNKTVERSLTEINAENAIRRIAVKSGEQPTFASRRDTLQDARTVFVGNVALSVRKKTLLRLFKTCGKVQTVRQRSAPVADLKLPKKASVITQQFHPSRHTANFYVVFESPSEAEKAVTLNGTELEGYHIRVDLAAVKKHDQQKSVFIGNIPFDSEEESLRKHFEPCGQITNVRIIRDRATGVGKGFGYVTFSDASSVSLAISMNNRDFSGRQLRVQRSTEKPRKAKQKKNVAFQRAEKSGDRAKNQKSRHNRTAPEERQRRPQTQANRQVKASDEERGRKKFDAKAMVDRRKLKEQRKKKLRKIAREKKKDSLGRFLTKQKD